MQTQPILVVGAGFWGKRWIETVRSQSDLELAGVVAKTDATLSDVRARFSLRAEQCFTDLTIALQKCAVDIVAIVSPAAAHPEHIRLALEADCHVICEKPLADSWPAALEIARCVRTHPRRQFMVAQTRRFTGQVETLRQAVAAGRIGRLDSIVFDHRVNYTGGGYRQRMEFPVLEDMICHHLDALRYITGQEPRSVFTVAWNPAWSQFSGQASNILWTDMTGGVQVSYFGSWTSRGQLNSYDGVIKAMGSKGSLDLTDARTLLLYPDTGAELSPNPEPTRIPVVEPAEREIAGVLRHFLAALRAGRAPMCDLEDNLKTFAWNCAAIESCRTRRPVDVQAWAKG